MPAKAAAAAPLVEPRRSPAGFIRVEHPAMWPQACVVCQSAKGPLVDTGHETVTGRLYVCAQCVKWSALELGLIDGEQMDELLAAGSSLAVAQESIDNLNLQIQSMLGDAAAQTRKVEALEELLEQTRNADRERRHLLEQQHEIAKQLLAVGA